MTLSETEQFVETARVAGVEVETLFLEDEGHPLRSADARIEVYRVVLDFLDRRMKNSDD